MTEKTYEQCLARIEEIISLLDDFSVSLDESVSLYNEGIQLSKLCFEKLDDAEKQVSIISTDFNNGLKKQNFEIGKGKLVDE